MIKKKNVIKSIEAGLVSAALGIAAGIALAPESGKKFKSDVKKKSDEFEVYLAPRLKKMKKIGKQEYDLFVKEAVKTYAEMKNLSKKEKSGLVSNARKSWKKIKKSSTV